MVLSLGPVDVKGKVSEAIRVQGALLDSGVQLVDAVPDDLPPIEADRERILQVVHNLVRGLCLLSPRGMVRSAPVLFVSLALQPCRAWVTWRLMPAARDGGTPTYDRTTPHHATPHNAAEQRREVHPRR